MTASDTFHPLNIAVLTVSDTRSEKDDTSGQLLIDSLSAAGHQLATRKIVIDDIYQIRAVLSAWIADESIQAVMSSIISQQH
jgi:molybdenum cofactor biosynthesis protein B